MSIQKQRNSLISSSNSINSIRDSVSNFSKGLGRTSSLASGIIAVSYTHLTLPTKWTV